MTAVSSAGNGSLGSSIFDRESILALVNVIQNTRSLSRKREGQEWDLEQLSRLMAILKGQSHRSPYASYL